MADLIRLSGVVGTGFHGVFDHEKRDGQPFVVDVELEADLTAAAATDELARTVNYGEIGAQALARIEGPPFDLIEALAGAIADDVMAAHRLVDRVRVTVHKPQAPVGVPFGDVEAVIERRRDPVPVVIALGANLGDAGGSLDSALAALTDDAGLTDVRASTRYRTEPVGGPDQPAYLNQVVTARTRWSAPRLLRALHAIEADHGRTRDIRWGARTLDLDLIQWGVPGTPGEWRSEHDDLMLPHPRAHERAFVLVPWFDADPEALVRVGEWVRPLRDLTATVERAGVERLPGTAEGAR